MAAVITLNPFSKTIKRHFLWIYVRCGALVRGIDKALLKRVAEFLDGKFDLKLGGVANPAQPNGHFPGLRSVPIYDHTEFAWVRDIESRAKDIRAEFMNLGAQGQLAPHPQKLTDAGSWSTYYLFSNGQRYEEHCDECPITAEVISQLPGGGTAGQAYFSVMSPGTHVKAHCGPTNTKIRCHLGIVVPETSRIRVADQTINWRESGCIVFDDSFEHEVWNPDSERAVLIIDLWHPDLTAEERWAVTRIAGLSGRHRNYRRDMKKKR